MVGPSLCVRVWLMVIALSFSPICFASFVRMICKKQPLSVAQLPNEQHLCKINSTQHTNAIFFSSFSAIMIKSFKYHFHKQGAHVSGSACVCVLVARVKVSRFAMRFIYFASTLLEFKFTHTDILRYMHYSNLAKEYDSFWLYRCWQKALHGSPLSDWQCKYKIQNAYGYACPQPLRLNTLELWQNLCFWTVQSKSRFVHKRATLALIHAGTGTGTGNATFMHMITSKTISKW